MRRMRFLSRKLTGGDGRATDTRPGDAVWRVPLRQSTGRPGQNRPGGRHHRGEPGVPGGIIQG